MFWKINLNFAKKLAKDKDISTRVLLMKIILLY